MSTTFFMNLQTFFRKCFSVINKPVGSPVKSRVERQRNDPRHDAGSRKTSLYRQFFSELFLELKFNAVESISAVRDFEDNLV